ncbi:MAG TPA: hypothetical protein VIV60_02315, partial [Polyangiaceae bacterium]
MTSVFRFRSVLISILAVFGCSKAPEGRVGPDAGPGASSERTASPAPSPANSTTALVAPTIGLDGAMTLPARNVRNVQPKIFARAIRTWIHDAPRAGAARIGTFRAGNALDMTGADGGRDGCPGGWRGVVPMGWVCVGQDATLDSNDPLVRALAEYPADLGRRLPYLYG